MPTVYTFEAKSVQRYILDSGKLSDMVRASELIEYLAGTLDRPLAKTSTLLGEVLTLAGVEDGAGVGFSRRGGGAFDAVFDHAETAREFRDLWTFAVRRRLPGLSFTQGLAFAPDLVAAMKEAKDMALRDRNLLYPELPEAGPLVARAPRTGRAAMGMITVDGVQERQDPALAAIRTPVPAGNGLEEKLHLPVQNTSCVEQLSVRWPTYLRRDEQTPEEAAVLLEGDEAYIAVVHADGNGMGQLLMELSASVQDAPAERRDELYLQRFQGFSRAIEQATTGAVQEAIRRELKPRDQRGGAMVLPARPLIVAGDDLSFILRADLALGFTRTFLESFEARSRELLGAVGDGLAGGLAGGLSACAGVALVKANLPFGMAYGLAESLCSFAKDASKADRPHGTIVPSSIAFHRVTTSLVEDYDAILQQELRIRHATREGSDGDGLRDLLLSMQPYAVGDYNTADEHGRRLPTLDQLISLAEELRPARDRDEPGLGRGALRELLRLLYYDSGEARTHYQRWRENLAKAQPALLQAIETTLGQLLPEPSSDYPMAGLRQGEEGTWRSPLGDAMTLAGLC